MFNINTQNWFGLLGGLAMFLYGMKILGDGLKIAAGARTKRLVERMAGTLLRGILTGALVTAVIQSSSATTVVVVGFVNTGIMSLGQAVGVIMGANIGTTITAHILRLGDIKSSVWYVAMFKPATMAPLIMALGVGMVMSGKKQSTKITGDILAGFGLLFLGMSNMESAVSGLKNIPQVRDAFSSMANPIYGVLTGTIVTAVIQSSSASVGILQAIATTGILHYSSAIPIIMGQNIGTCITAALSSIGTCTNAKRAACIHFLFNLIGVIVLMPIIYLANYFFRFAFWETSVDMGGIANFHTLFNVVNTVLLAPFALRLVKLATYLVKEPKRKR